jgi:hypothetical protein
MTSWEWFLHALLFFYWWIDGWMMGTCRSRVDMMGWLGFCIPINTFNFLSACFLYTFHTVYTHTIYKVSFLGPWTRSTTARVCAKPVPAGPAALPAGMGLGAHVPGGARLTAIRSGLA